jgi:lipid-A-disaccharide synthase
MSLCILATEQSGDQLGARLLHQIKQPAFGMGGPMLQQAGLESLCPLTHVMGITDVICSLPQLMSQFFTLLNHILKRSPQVVVTIDSPDFFMPLHSLLRKRGYRGKIVHVVSPSVWAWRPKRAQTLAKYIDRLVCLLPFEADYYKHTSLDVKTVDHPLAFELLTQPILPVSTPSKKPILALFPGSREGAIRKNLPLQLEAASFFPDHEIYISLARQELCHLIPKEHPTVLAHERHSLMKSAELAIATSGTICLELALLGTPCVATYKLTSLNYCIGHHLLKIHRPFYTLPNIILNRGLVAEHIGLHLSAADIASSLSKLQANKNVHQQLTNSLKECFKLENDPSFEMGESISEFLKN